VTREEHRLISMRLGLSDDSVWIGGDGGPRCHEGTMRGGRCGAGKRVTGGDLRPFKGVPW
jgi:hypothetical protein